MNKDAIKITESEISEENYNHFLDRNNNLDLFLNNISYYQELQKTQKLISNFLETLVNQMIIIASGGHRSILDALSEDELNEFLFDELAKDHNNEPLHYLNGIYEGIVHDNGGLHYLLEKLSAFNNEEIENMVDIM